MILSGKRILIVEDDIRSKMIMQLLLERAGASTIVERWGIKATELIGKVGPFDAILLDLVLPNHVSGFEVFTQIRQLDIGRKTPIVAVSAADATEAISKAQTLGFSGFISKPVDFLAFPQQIYRIISGETLWYEAKGS